ncbi:MAG: glycosyltransferase family 4 protein [Pseudomonadota bacterium]
MIAFYAPLKSPNHPTPSGDRTMARALMNALEGAVLVSELRIYDKDGDAAQQEALMQEAEAEVQRLLAHANAGQWRAWLTYHNYYKAPDLIGPAVCAALGIPYLAVESTRARKRLTGPWARFAAAAEAASDAAAAVFYLTARDAEALRAYAPEGQKIVHLRPFLDRDVLPMTRDGDGGILSVGMMRRGDKLDSYTLIAQTLGHLTAPDWRLNVVGDGPARAEVAALLAPFGAQVHFAGRLDADALQTAYANAAVLLWPGVNEAFGLSYLEAQACGVPVVAQDRPGVRDVVHAPLAPVQDGPQALAAMIDRLLADEDLRLRRGRAARQRVAAYHLRGAAAACLARTIAEVTA